MEPSKVPIKLEARINYKVLGLILAGAVAFQAFLYITEDKEAFEEMVYYVSMATPLISGSASFYVAFRYGMSQVFGKSFLILGVALISVFLAEVTYYAYEVILEIDPYPSIADIFFFALYPLAAIHILINLRFFKNKTDIKQKALFAAIPIVIFSIYSYVSLEEIGEANFDYYYGIIFVAGTAVLLSLAVLGAIVFRGGLLGTAWVVLLVGILIFTIGDVWYYYLEVFGGYDLLHPVNLFWYVSDFLIIYALYKHSKSF